MEESGGSGAGYASSGGDSPSPTPSAASHDGTPGTTVASLAGPSSGSPAAALAAAADGTTDLKKLRACEACRGLKVRCEPNPIEGQPCKRCKKAGRRCVVTAPTRKRQKKTDSRVSELERKIDALTASLQARTGGGGGVVHQQQQQERHGRAAQEHRSWESEVAPWDSGRPADQDSHFQQLITMAGRKRKAMEDGDAGEGGSSGQGAATLRRPARPAAAANDDDNRRPSAAAAAVGWPAYTSRATDGDVVDRGLVPLELAARLFSRYKTQMVRHLPGVVFPPTTTVAVLRATRPVLFLAVLAAAAGEDHALQRVLQKELMRIFADKIIVTGEKSLELVQALNVAVIWYWPPEYFEELKFYQLIHTAAVMAIDIGLGRKTNGRVRRNQTTTPTPVSMGWRGDPSRHKTPPPDPTSLEARRTWLTCFYLASNTAMSLHRPNLIRWTPFMAESMALLEASPDAAPTDKYFCHLVWTHHLGEQIGAQLSMDDPDAVVDIADARTQYALRALERDLERYRAGVPPERMQATLKIGFDLLNLYMHETVLHADNATDVGTGAGFHAEALQDGLVRDAQQPLSAQHVNALTSCLTAINGIFATFLGLDVDSIRCLPVFNFVRVAYAVVVLMKMYFSAEAAAGSDFGAVFTRESMGVQAHLDALLDKFRKTAAEDKCRPASKFLVVLAMLRSWFVKQGKTTEAGGGGAQQQRSAGAPLQTQTQQQYQPQTANTPLQMLSEVATGSTDLNNTGSASSPFGYYRASSTAAPTTFFPDAAPPTTAGAETSSSSAPFDAAGNMYPWIAEAMLSGGGGGFDAGTGTGEFPAMGMGAVQGFDGASAATNDQFWTDMFQGTPDPNMFTF